jgi:hypothetical protein
VRVAKKLIRKKLFIPTAKNCEKLRKIARNCKKLQEIARNCEKLREIAKNCENRENREIFLQVFEIYHNF